MCSRNLSTNHQTISHATLPNVKTYGYAGQIYGSVLSDVFWTNTHTHTHRQKHKVLFECCAAAGVLHIRRFDWPLSCKANVKHTSCVGVMVGNRLLLVPSCQWLCCGSRDPGSGGVGPQAEWLCVSRRGMWCATALIRCCFSAETCLESPRRLLRLVFIAWELL